MSRYIDADALLKNFQEKLCFNVECSICPFQDDENNSCMVEDWIKEEPTADVIEVVRCKNCRNWDRLWISSMFSENVHYCTFLDTPCNGNFYCGAAVKRQVLGGDKIEI